MLECGHRQRGGFRKSFPVIITLSLICILIIALLSAWESSHPVVLVGYGLNSVESSVYSSPVLNPTVEHFNETELVSQIPDSPKAVLFLAHGCYGRAVNFWDKSDSCPDCIGLPEERLVVLKAPSLRFAVLAISSAGTCWSYGRERVTVRDAILWWVKMKGLQRIPLVAMGSSSGVNFLSLLANDEELRFSSIVIMIAEGRFDRMDVKADYPPTLFLHMPKDQKRNKLIPKNAEMLRKKGIDAGEAKCFEIPLTRSFLADRIPGLGQRVSERLYELFLEKGFIDANGFMKKAEVHTPWIRALNESGIPFPYGTTSIRHVQEELNAAFAYHEMTSCQSEEMFRWFDSHMR